MFSPSFARRSRLALTASLFALAGMLHPHISARLAVCAEAADFAKLAPELFSAEDRKAAAAAIDRDIERRKDASNRLDREQWNSQITSKAAWEKFRDQRIARLRESLGSFPKPANPLPVRVTSSIAGDRFRIDNLLYESRPGLWVSGNLYRPSQTPAGKAPPGMVIATSHHNAKTQSELQDMGMTWARAGCLVLVIDSFGYGERRLHPFSKDSDYEKPYRASRQDYYFRYDSGIQLQLLGDSLMGWMVWDLMRGFDLLLAEGADPERLILLGSVAGGGDPAGVAAALDPRIDACVPFNFGGPQPETRYPLPDDADQVYNFLGWTYWDSTRGLRLTGRDEFLHWTICASLAPRRLIHAHEFAWDQPRDPVWKRYQKIWGDFYGAPENIGFTHGSGKVTLRPPEATHCNNIGLIHRRMIHPLFERWFGIQVKETDEYSSPRPSSELLCFTADARSQLKIQPPLEILSAIAAERLAASRAKLSEMSPSEQRNRLQDQWAKLLGPIQSNAKPQATPAQTTDEAQIAGVQVDRLILRVEADFDLPLLILRPEKTQGRLPVVVALAQAGKAGFLTHRGEDLQQLLAGGAMVVLPDLRGTGEIRSGSSRGRDSSGTNHSVYVQLFGETLVGQRLRDLRSVLAYLRDRKDVDASRIALWGDSFTPPSEKNVNYRVPHGVDGVPPQPEPLGGLLAFLGALYEPEIKAVAISGGLQSYHGVLTHWAALVPHDACVPGMLTAGDLPDLAAALAPKPLRLAALVDHLNRSAPIDAIRKEYSPAQKSSADSGLTLSPSARGASAWLLEQLR